LVAIEQWGCIEWQSKKFGRHSTYPHCHMATEELQLPSNTLTPLDGEQNSSISQEGMNFVFSTIITHACTFFNCHLMMGVCQKVIKVFDCQKGGGGRHM